MTTPNERRRYAEARKNELPAAVDADRDRVSVDARRRVIATAGNRKGQRGIVTGPPAARRAGTRVYLPVAWADGTSTGYHKADLDTVWSDPQCAQRGCHAFFDGTTWYAVDSVLIAHEHYTQADLDEHVSGQQSARPLKPGEWGALEDLADYLEEGARDHDDGGAADLPGRARAAARALRDIARDTTTAT